MINQIPRETAAEVSDTTHNVLGKVRPGAHSPHSSINRSHELVRTLANTKDGLYPADTFILDGRKT